MVNCLQCGETSKNSKEKDKKDKSVYRRMKQIEKTREHFDRSTVGDFEIWPNKIIPPPSSGLKKSDTLYNIRIYDYGFWILEKMIDNQDDRKLLDLGSEILQELEEAQIPSHAKKCQEISRDVAKHVLSFDGCHWESIYSYLFALNFIWTQKKLTEIELTKATVHNISKMAKQDGEGNSEDGGSGKIPPILPREHDRIWMHLANALSMNIGILPEENNKNGKSNENKNNNFDKMENGSKSKNQKKDRQLMLQIWKSDDAIFSLAWALTYYQNNPRQNALYGIFRILRNLSKVSKKEGGSDKDNFDFGALFWNSESTPGYLFSSAVKSFLPAILESASTQIKRQRSSLDFEEKIAASQWAVIFTSWLISMSNFEDFCTSFKKLNFIDSIVEAMEILDLSKSKPSEKSAVAENSEEQKPEPENPQISETKKVDQKASKMTRKKSEKDQSHKNSSSTRQKSSEKRDANIEEDPFLPVIPSTELVLLICSMTFSILSKINDMNFTESALQKLAGHLLIYEKNHLNPRKKYPSLTNATMLTCLREFIRKMDRVEINIEMTGLKPALKIAEFIANKIENNRTEIEMEMKKEREPKMMRGDEQEKNFPPTGNRNGEKQGKFSKEDQNELFFNEGFEPNYEGGYGPNYDYDYDQEPNFGPNSPSDNFYSPSYTQNYADSLNGYDNLSYK